MGAITSPSAASQSAGIDPDFPNRSDYFDDCIANYSSNPQITSTGLGGTVASLGTPEAGCFGVYRLSRGTTAANTCGFAGRNLNLYAFGDGSVFWQERVRIPTLSDATNRFGLMTGLTRTSANDTPQNGVFFYLRDDVNGGRWEARTSAGVLGAADRFFDVDWMRFTKFFTTARG